MSRIDARFKALKAEGRSAFVTYIQAGDPDYQTSLDILSALPLSGADIIELGMPFTDPGADGPAIDKAAQRALQAGQTMDKTLGMVRHLRERDNETPVVLMGYFNPIMARGIDTFCADAAAAGVDGLIIVDLPPEEDGELLEPALRHGINLIRLATPTSDDERMKVIANGASGFIYYVAVAGVTGGKSAGADDIKEAVARIKRHSDLPMVVGFGIKTPEQAKMMAELADGAVVGSAIVQKIADGLDADHKARDGLVDDVLQLVASLAEGVRAAKAP